MKPRQLLELIDDPSAKHTVEGGEATELLHTLLAHLIFADRRLDDGELALFARIAPPGVDVQKYIDELSGRALDLDRLAALYPDPQDRDDIVTLAEHAVWGDNEVDAREWDLVDDLVEKLGVVRD